MTDDRIIFLQRELEDKNIEIEQLRLKLELDKDGADYVKYIKAQQIKRELEYKLRDTEKG